MPHPSSVIMATKKKGFIARMIEGPERSDTYAKSTMPGNRWELGWSVFRDNLGKVVSINLLMLLFFIPVIAIFVFRYLLIQYYAYSMPFSQNLGIGYPSIPTTSGLSEQIYLEANRMTFMLMPIAGLIAAVGLSGGMYVMRNMVWSEGVFVGSDFWTGVKKNYLVTMISTLCYTVMLFLCMLSISYADYLTAAGQGGWLLTVSLVITYIMLVFFTLMYLYSLSMGVTYKLKFRHLIKNTFIMTLALLPTNLFFAAFALITVIIMMLGSLGLSFGSIAFIFVGLAGGALVWTNYSQWVFDKFINDKVPGAVKNRGIYTKNAEDEEADFSFERSTLGKRPIKPITDYDVEIVELPDSFSRDDLRKLEESKAAMRKNSDEYVESMLKELAEEKKKKEAEEAAAKNNKKVSTDEKISDDDSAKNDEKESKAENVASVGETENDADNSDTTERD